jgi:hypothetical protein
VTRCRDTSLGFPQSIDSSFFFPSHHNGGLSLLSFAPTHHFPLAVSGIVRLACSVRSLLCQGLRILVSQPSRDLPSRDHVTSQITVPQVALFVVVYLCLCPDGCQHRLNLDSCPNYGNSELRSLRHKNFLYTTDRSSRGYLIY